jgi:hypothetical protein
VPYNAAYKLCPQVLNGQAMSFKRDGLIGRCDWVLPKDLMKGAVVERWLELSNAKGQTEGACQQYTLIHSRFHLFLFCD